MTDTATLVREKLPYGAWRTSDSRELWPETDGWVRYNDPDQVRASERPDHGSLTADQITEKLDGCERCGGSGKIAPFGAAEADEMWLCPAEPCRSLRALLNG
jgi:hypothetical protein